MKNGRSLVEVATELERQAKTKKDYIAPSAKLSMRALSANTDNPSAQVILDGVNGGMGLRPIAHAQMASVLQIPKPYYDRMLSEQPDLLAKNVNTWLAQRGGQKQLVRTLDNQVRAILSDSYRPLDNFELAEAVLPKLASLEAQVLSCEVTDSRLYLKAATERIQGQVKVGDTVQAGLMISNSEVGQGSLQVAALDYRLVCLNGMIRDHAVRKAHLGRGSRGQDAIEDAREFFRDETRAADDRAFFLKVQDAVASMFIADKFMQRIEQYKEASERMINVEKINDVVEVAASRYQLNETEGKSVLTHLIQGGSLTQWGLANAITRAAQDVESYDRSTEMEAFGGKVIELTKSDWRTLAGSPA